MKAIVFFYDGTDIATGIFTSMEQALREHYVQIRGNEFIPYGANAIIFWYSDAAPYSVIIPPGAGLYPPDSRFMLEEVERYYGQRLSDLDVFNQIAATARF